MSLIGDDELALPYQRTLRLMKNSGSDSWYRRIRNWFFGYDFFVSYHWQSGGTYAVNLAARLRERGYEVFLDRAEYAMGDDWKHVGEVALRNTQRLVLIATREAVFASKPVEREVILFTDRRRHCIPIFFGDRFTLEEQATSDQHVVLDRLPDATLHIQDDIENLATGPSTVVLEKLVGAHRIMRRRLVRSITVATTMAVLAVAAIVSAVLGGSAHRSLGLAEERLAQTSLQNGHRAIQSGEDIDAALLWYADALQTTGWRSEYARQSARSLIGAWIHSIPRHKLVHENTIHSISLDPKGQTLATACEDNIRLWSVATGELLDERVAFSPEDDGFLVEKFSRIVRFSPDGATLAAATTQGKVRLWDVPTYQVRGQLPCHSGAITTLAFSPEGNLLATASNGTLFLDDERGNFNAGLWDVKTLKPILPPIKHHDFPCLAVAISRDGKFLGIANGNAPTQQGNARLLNVDSGQVIGEPLIDGQCVYAITFGPDGLRLAAGGGDSLDEKKAWAQIWDSAGEAQGHRIHHNDAVKHVAFSPNGNFLASGSEDGTVRLSPARELKPPDAFYGKSLKHAKAISDLSFSHDSRTIATSSEDATVCIWDVLTGELRAVPLKHDGPVTEISYPSEAGMLATASDNEAFVWTVDNVQPRLVLKHKYQVSDAAFSPDGNVIVAACSDLATSAGEVSLWDHVTGQALGDPIPHKCDVMHVKFSPCGRKFLKVCDASGTDRDDHCVRLWDATTREPIGKPIEHTNQTAIGDVVRARIFDAEFSGNGLLIATAASDSKVRLWDASTGQPHGKPLHHVGGVVDFSFSPDSSILATAQENFLELWNVATQERTGPPIIHEGQISHVQRVLFSPAGDMVSTGSANGQVRFWDAVTRKELGKSLQHPGVVTCLSFSPNGKSIACASEKHENSGSLFEVRLWDLATGEPLGAPLRHDSVVSTVAFSPDGREVLTTTLGGAIMIWNVPIPVVDDPKRVRLSIEVRTRKRIENGDPRALTEDEWRELKESLNSLGGDCINRIWEDLSNSERESLRTPSGDDSFVIDFRFVAAGGAAMMILFVVALFRRHNKAK